jgi:hypothetical protein
VQAQQPVITHRPHRSLRKSLTFVATSYAALSCLALTLNGMSASLSIFAMGSSCEWQKCNSCNGAGQVMYLASFSRAAVCSQASKQ